MSNPRVAWILALAIITLSIGCYSQQEADNARQDSVLNKKTQDIGEAMPEGNEADMAIKKNDSLKALPGAYGFAASELAKGQIKQMVDLYYAENGEYPKTHEEFMDKIIRRYKIELPVLPGGRKYQYDVKNHKLIVVEAESE